MTDLTFTLRLKTPCHGRQVRLNALRFVPREVFHRECRECGTLWRIERETVSERAPHQTRIDKTTWEIRP